MKNKKKIIVIVIVLLLLGLFTFLQLRNDDRPNQKTFVPVPKQYMDLFRKDIVGDITQSISYQSVYRSPISCLYYDRFTYCLVIYKLSNTTLQFDKSIFVNTRPLHRSKREYLFVAENFTYAYVDTPSTKSINSIDIYANDIKKIIQNDSVELFLANLGDFYMGYNSSDTFDVILKSKTSIPVSIIFLKKHNEIYFIVFFRNDFLNFNSETLLKIFGLK